MAQAAVETVEASGVGHQGSLALDRGGEPCIAYASLDGGIRWGRREAGSWVLEDLSSGTFSSTAPDDRICIDVDSAGDPHVAYKDRESGHLIHAVRRSDWVLEEVPTRGGTLARGVDHISFQLHPGKMSPEQRDEPNISFHDTLNSALGHVVRTGGRWLPTLVEDPDIRTAGLFTSLGIDVEERVRIAYFEGGEGHLALKMAELFNGEWVKTVLDDDIEGESASFARGTLGRTYIAYFDRRTSAVKAWVHSIGLPEPREEVVAAGLALPTAPSAAADPQGGLRVAYSDGGMKLARRDESGRWTTEILDPETAGQPSLACGPDGRFHMTYRVGSALRYASGTA